MILRPVRTTQPQGPARIDWSNPITRGLVVAFNPASGIHNLVDDKQPVVLSGLTRKIDGVVTLSGNPAQIGWSTGKRDSFSYFSRTIHRNGIARVGGIFSASSSMNFYFEGFASGQPVRLTRFNGGNYSTRINSNYYPAEGQLLNLGVRVNANIKLWIDGKSYGENTSDGDTSLIEQAGLMYRQSGSQFPDNVQGTHAYFCWGRDLTDAEFKSISDNPWQIFAPDSKSLWVPETVSAGGGATTGTLAATESGSDTAVISGQVVVQGAIAATESGSDTSDLAAKVIVQGTLAATEAGQDTAALAGQVIITGTLAAAEIGSDIAVINGSASVTTTGTLAATESGSDTAALTGQVLVQGALSVTESGSDAAAIAGQVFVQGTLAAIEQGSDTALINGSSVITTTGTLDATEQGGDTAAMTGQVLVQALIDAAEQGADTAQLAGQIVVTGVLTAVEVGGDTAAFFGPLPVATGIYPDPATVFYGVQYGPTGVEYTGMLTIGSTGPTAAEIAAAVWQQAARTLTTGGGSGGATPEEIWGYMNRTLTSGNSLAPTAAENAAAVQAALAANLALLDVAVSTRVATGTIVKANVLAIKDQTVLGEGTQANPWRPA